MLWRQSMALTKENSNIDLDDKWYRFSTPDEANWTELHTAEDMASPNYTFSNEAFKGAMDAMGPEVTYKQYKRMIEECEKAKDTDGLYDILKTCIDKIQQRSPGKVLISDQGLSFNDESITNGAIKVKVFSPEDKSPEGKAIRLIVSGGGNWLTAALFRSKIAKTGSAARKDVKDSELGSYLKNIASELLYGAKRVEQAGSTYDIAAAVGDNMARVILLEDIGFKKEASALQQSYQATLDRYRSANKFIKATKYYCADAVIQMAAQLPTSAVTHELQQDLADARQISNDPDKQLTMLYAKTMSATANSAGKKSSIASQMYKAGQDSSNFAEGGGKKK